MGCCMSRDDLHVNSIQDKELIDLNYPVSGKTHSAKQIKSDEIIEESNQTDTGAPESQVGIAKFQFQDQQAQDIMNYLDVILGLTDWQFQDQKPAIRCSIRIRIGSKYNSEFPMNHTQLTLDPYPLEKIYEAMYNPEIRQSWDKSIAELRHEPTSTEAYKDIFIHSKFPFPLKDRCLMERNFIGRTENLLVVTYYSIPLQYEGKCEVGESIFGITYFQRFEDRIEAHLISQIDFKLAGQAKHAKLGMTNIFTWVRNFQKHLAKA